MTDFEQQKRLSKLEITQDCIDAVKRIKFPALYDDENDRIYELHQKLLQRSKDKNNSDEVGFLICIMDDENWQYKEIFGKEDGIELKNVPEARDMFYTSPKNSLIFMHNHPKNSTFSEVDLNSFLAADSLLMMTVVCNNGRIYSLTKEEGFDDFEAISYYNSIFDSVNYEDSAVAEFLRTCSKVKLIYGYGGE